MFPSTGLFTRSRLVNYFVSSLFNYNKVFKNCLLPNLLGQNNSHTSQRAWIYPKLLCPDTTQGIKPIIRSVRSVSRDDDIVCYKDLKKLKKTSNILIMDVRNKNETWRTGTIPGSICVPLNELESALNMSADLFHKTYCKDKPNTTDHIIFLCRRGERSFKAMKQAKMMGYKNSKTYQGGFMNWFNQERLKREKKRTRQS